MGKCIVPYEKEYMDFLLVECGLEKETSIGYMKELRNFMEWLQNSGFSAEPEEVPFLPQKREGQFRCYSQQ